MTDKNLSDVEVSIDVPEGKATAKFTGADSKIGVWAVSAALLILACAGLAVVVLK